MCFSAKKLTKGLCWREGVAYQIDCLVCLARGVQGLYYGESGFSGYQRGKAHLEGLASRDEDNVMVAHNEICHPDMMLTRKDFRMSVMECFRRPILRQAFEGLSISRSISERERGRNIVLMNSKKEFCQPGTIRPQFKKIFSSEQIVILSKLEYLPILD